MAAVPSHEHLQHLKESLRKLAPTALFEPAAEPGGLTTGFPDLDARLATGGLAAGRIHEIAGPPSSGKSTLALAAVSRCAGLTAFIDGSGQLFPPAAAALGVDLDRLLIVRPPATGIARAAEIAIRSRGFELLVIDLPAQVGLDRHRAHRLRTAAHQRGVTVVVLAPCPGAASSAHTRIELAPSGDLHAPGACALIHKGSRTGGLERVEIALPGFRSAGPAPVAVAPPLERTPPGVDPLPKGVAV